MLQWVYIMAHTGGRGAKVNYGSAFFHWLDDQLLMVEDYAYDGTEFRGYPNLPLAVDSQWGYISKKNAQDIHYFLHFDFMIFMNDNKTKSFHADVGDSRPGVSSPIDKQARALFVHCGYDELTELEENINWLTLDIPDASIDDLPRRY